MNHIITLSIASIFTSLILVGCSATTSSPESHTGTVHNKNLTQEKVHNIIKTAGKENGWIMTEFKSNTLLAEKIDNGDSKSLTIKFDKSSFDIEPSNSELEDAINDALE